MFYAITYEHEKMFLLLIDYYVYLKKISSFFDQRYFLFEFFTHKFSCINWL